MKRHFFTALTYTCISFTAVSVLLTVLTMFDIQPQLGPFEVLQLLVVCAVLSTAQMVCNLVPAIENRHWLRAIINVGLLLGLGGWFFGWYEQGIIGLVGGALVSLFAYLAVWVVADFEIRQAAKDINEVLEKRREG